MLKIVKGADWKRKKKSRPVDGLTVLGVVSSKRVWTGDYSVRNKKALTTQLCEERGGNVSGGGKKGTKEKNNRVPKDG